MNIKLLAAPFPKQAVHWRAQSLTRDGKKAMALAYLDARDVMDRLDLVCGPAGWQDSHVETPRGRIISSIGIKIGDEWVWKSDGAGDTAVEGEKGGISDGLKRAAVHWGIGRYLYRLGSPWVPCKTYDRQGKAVWDGWAESPWDHVKNAPIPPDEIARDIFQKLNNGANPDAIRADHGSDLKLVEVLVPNIYREHIEPKLKEAA